MKEVKINPNNMKLLTDILKKYNHKKEMLIAVLQDTQEMFTFLPFKALEVIAEDLNVSLEEVYQVVTFYSQFKLQQKGKYQICVCLGTACYVKGSNDIFEELKNVLKIEDGEATKDGIFSLDSTRCLGCCSLAPIITINDKIYSNVTVSSIQGLIASYRGESNEK